MVVMHSEIVSTTAADSRSDWWGAPRPDRLTSHRGWPGSSGNPWRTRMTMRRCAQRNVSWPGPGRFTVAAGAIKRALAPIAPRKNFDAPVNKAQD